MNEPLQPGVDGERLPGNENVLRMATSLDGKVSPEIFYPSSEDERGPYKSLSVWAVRLTSCDQAREFMEGRKILYCLCASLNVDKIRILRPDPDSPDIKSLDVIWESIVDERPGAQGHAGITGLHRLPGQERGCFKNLRTQLADLANENLTLLPDLS